MNIKTYLVFLMLTFSLINPYHLEKEEVSSFIKDGTHNRLDVGNFFQDSDVSLKGERFVTDPLVLQSAARAALRYFKSKNKNNRNLVKPKLFEKKLNANKVQKTLEFIISTIERDKKRKSSQRILDPNFLEKNFKFMKWSGDALSAKKNKVEIPEGKIRLTNYAVFVANGSDHKTSKFNCSIYGINDKNFINKDRFNYTKQDVLSGVLEKPENKNKVRSLAWVTRDDFETAVMQGSSYIKMPNGDMKYFNVDKNNGYVYDKKIKDPKQQKRYWYFKEVGNPRYLRKGWVHLNFGGALFAGDIFNIGLGKIIAIRYKNRKSKRAEVRLGLLLDSGSALTGNLYQLDLFAGVFDNKSKFKDWLWQIPNTVEAYILIKK